MNKIDKARLELSELERKIDEKKKALPDIPQYFSTDPSNNSTETNMRLLKKYREILDSLAELSELVAKHMEKQQYLYDLEETISDRDSR